MSFFQKDIETMPRAELEKLQLEKLKHITKYCYDNVPLYKRKFDEAGFDCTKIKALSDIQYIPYTTKTDFRDNYPFGMFATPLKNVTRLHASSGTTGKPTVVGYTKNDLDMWSDCVARLVTAAGATDEDIVQIAFGYGLFTGALGLHYGLEKIGATVVPCSSGNTEKQVMLMKDFGTTALVATPSYAMRIGEVAEEMGIGRDELKLRLGLFGSEGCTPEMRAQIRLSASACNRQLRHERAYGTRCFGRMFTALRYALQRGSLPPRNHQPRNRRGSPRRLKGRACYNNTFKGGNPCSALSHKGYYFYHLRKVRMRKNSRPYEQALRQKR